MRQLTIHSLILIVVSVFVFSACEDYLVRTPESEISEEEVFSSFESFQGFVEQMYNDDVDVSHSKGFWAGSFYLSDHAHINTGSWQTGAAVANGQYFGFYSQPNNHFGGQGSAGYLNDSYQIYDDSWEGIRVANKTLANIDMLKDATQDEKDLIKGQAYFFRGYFHWRLAKWVGGLPYVDTLLTPTSNLEIPRHNWQATADKIVQDLDKAAELLPMDWDQIAAGSATRGNNEGRATKGAAMGYKAKVLLFAGSPLMNKYSGDSPTSGLYSPAGSATYDLEYMERAAEAAWEVMKLSEDFGSGFYGLVNWDNYYRNFYTMDGTFPWTKETIWNNNTSDAPNAGWLRNNLLQYFMPANWGNGGASSSRTASPTQNLVDQFEASNGYPIDHPQANYDPNNPWENRDPRFDYNILVNGEKHGDSPNAVPDLYLGGESRNKGGVTGYLMEKYWPAGANKWDRNYSGHQYNFPNLRLAEIYLIYAEAVNEAYGPMSIPPFEAGAPSAVDAVNLVRNRANHTDVPGEFTGSKSDFREVIRNEREVELCFEVGSHWFDIRRWYTAHEEENRIEYGLEFDEGQTFFRKVEVNERIFPSERYYWVPFPRATTNIYSGWRQNPGW